MLDLPELVFEDSEPEARGRQAAPVAGSSSSPLRPWGMWGGWAALGIACAGAVAHAFSRVGASVAGRSA
jgi:hypothetical protein